MILYKSDFSNYQQCPKRVWLSKYSSDKPEYSIDPYLAEFGNIIGTRAREWAKECGPSGASTSFFEFTRRSGRNAVEHTREQLKFGTELLFEAAFIHNEVYCRVDLLWNRDGAQVVGEVKSSTSIKDLDDAEEKYGLDLGVQYYAMTTAIAEGHLNLAALELITPEPETSATGIHGVNFKRTDMLCSARNMQVTIGSLAEEMQELLESPYEPVINMGAHCKRNGGCPFVSHCRQGKYDLLAYELPGFGGNWRKLPKLDKSQYPLEMQTPVAEISEQLLTTPLFQRIQKAERNLSHFLDENARSRLKQLKAPYGYLDFEFTSLPYSPIDSVAVGERIPFQYVLYRRESDEIEVERPIDYLNLDDADPRRQFAERLLKDCQGLNTIFVYNKAAEAGVISSLIKLYPELEIPLSSVRDKIYDLLDVVRENYYHPDMMGSYSLKKVLPTIGLSYDDLVVQGGNEAQLSYLIYRHAPERLSNSPETTKEQLKEQLKAYCRRDTLGMVKLHDFLLTGQGALQPKSVASRGEKKMKIIESGSVEKPADMPRKDSSITWYHLLGLFGIIVLTWAVIAPISFYFFGSPKGPAELGNSFGVAESLFSALGLAGIILSIILQQRDARLTRHEVAESAAAQKESARALEKQAELHILTTRIQALSVLIESANQQINQNDRWNAVAGDKKRYDNQKIFQKRRQAETELWRLKEQLDIMERGN